MQVLIPKHIYLREDLSTPNTTWQRSFPNSMWTLSHFFLLKIFHSFYKIFRPIRLLNGLISHILSERTDKKWTDHPHVNFIFRT